MANFPTPRSLQSILGEMLDGYLSRSGARAVKVGGPILSFLEVAAQSDVRSTQDIFDLLVAQSLDNSTGSALKALGISQDVQPIGEVAARGFVTISDTSFSKISSTIFRGQPAPLVGSTTIYVVDASSFPATGQVYLGRGTLNYEGPISYTTKTSLGGGTYWSLTLSTPTQSFHNYTETVILAQGGDRTVPSGQIVSTPAGNTAVVVSFATTQSVTLLDGEVSIDNVPITCQTPGLSGNVSIGAITSVSSPAFKGMAVTNPQRLSNGLANEDDQTYRERIKSTIQSRSKGTDLAIRNSVLGLTSTDESSRITSASIFKRAGQPSLLVIDDGTGYEEKTQGVGIETIVDSANGGEQDFELVNRPVTKASAETSFSAPFNLQDSGLAVKVGGVIGQHNFSPEDFVDITNASAYETIASINRNPLLLFGAKVVGGGVKFAITAKQETNDDIEVVDASGVTNDAATITGLPKNQINDISLYLNDRPLYKDGLVASIQTAQQSNWAGVTSGDTLILSVDGTSPITYTFVDQDFVDAGTSYVSVAATNSLESWATVINAKVVGVTATVGIGNLTITSNRGAKSTASLVIDSASTLIGKGMFRSSVLTSTGKSNDYTLDRNRGKIFLTQPLAAGDTLSAGTRFPRAYIESTGFTSVVVASTAKLYFVVDGTTQVIPTGLSGAGAGGLYLKVTVGGPVKRYTAYTDVGLTTASYAFTNVKVGDYMIAWDNTAFAAATPSTAAALAGISGVSNVDPLGQWFEVDTDLDAAPGAPGYWTITGLAQSGITFVRTGSAGLAPVEVDVVAGTYGPADLATTISNNINIQLENAASAYVFDTNKVRVQSNSYSEGAGIALVAKNTAASVIPLAVETAVNTLGHIAHVEASNGTGWIPSFNFSNFSTVGGTYTLATTVENLGAHTNYQLGFLKPLSTTGYTNRFGSLTGTLATIRSDVAGTLTLEAMRATGVADNGVTYMGDRCVPLHTMSTGPQDTLSVVLDQDPVGKQFAVNMFRRVIPDAAVSYGSTIRLKDHDNSDSSLASVFGTSYDFFTWTLFMKSRVILDKADNTKAALWRFQRYGPEGNYCTVQYGRPTGPSTSTTVTTTPGASTNDISINLPGGADRAISIDAAQKFALRRSNDTATSSKVTYVCGFTVATMQRTANVTTVTVSFPTDVADHQYINGDQVYITNPPVGYTAGLKTITRTGASTFTYPEVAGNQGPDAGAGTYASWNSNVIDFTTALVGDYVSIASTTSLPAEYQGVFRVKARGKLYFQVNTDLLGAATTAYYPINTANSIKFFPVGAANSVSSLVSAVNALTSGILKGVVLGTGAGLQTQASIDSYYQGSLAATATPLVDGVNYVSSVAYNGGAGNYDITLKNSVSANLSSPNDYANEEMRFVPVRVPDQVTYLNTGAITGLGASAFVQASHDDRLTLASQSVGSGSAIQVQGGSANSVAAQVYGSCNSSGVLKIKNADSNGLFGTQWVAIQNSVATPRLNDWTTSTKFAIDGTTRKVTVSVAGNAWRYSGSMSAPVVGGKWSIERHGGFVAYVLDNDDQSAPSANFSTVKGGDFALVGSRQGETSVGPAMNSGRGNLEFPATLLDGTILLAGSRPTDSTQVDLYDPATNTITNLTSDPLPGARNRTFALTINGGDALVIGGDNTSGGSSATNSCFRYNPNAVLGTRWSVGATMAVKRRHARGALLPNGTVMVCGGTDETSTDQDTGEIYNPDTNSWVAAGNTMSQARAAHSCVLMHKNNKVLITGGTAIDSADLFDYTTQLFTPAAAPGQIRSDYGAIEMVNGDVLVFGGKDGGGNSLASAQLYSPLTDTWSSAASMNVARRGPGFCRLDDGRILVVGGCDTASNPILSTEIYDPVTNTWVFGGGLKTARSFAPATILNNGKVLVSGGAIDNAFTYTSTTEIYDPALGISEQNAGLVRVARVLYDGGNKKYAFWVENDNAVEELTDIPSIYFLNQNSTLPGDSWVVGTNTLGVNNQGVWQVTGIDTSSSGKSFVIAGAPTTVSATAPGSDIALVSVTPSEPCRLIRKLKYLCPSSSDPTYLDVLLDSADNYEQIGAASGSVINALGKYEFPTDIVSGTDSYRYNTGLIKEANKVVYGDPLDTSAYPGIVASGGTVNISGPVIRRVKISLGIRLRSGVFDDVKIAVQNQVAAIVAQSPAGQPIAISSIVTAAAGVDGVGAVTVLYPTYNSSQDQIDVQPNEKALVIDASQDILVSLVGI